MAKEKEINEEKEDVRTAGKIYHLSKRASDGK